MRTYDAEMISARLESAPACKVLLRLNRNESAWNPACTSCLLWGPCEIQYRRYPDGGVVATVRYYQAETAASGKAAV